MKSFHKIPSLEKEEEASDEESDSQNRRIALSDEEWEDIRQTVDGSYDRFSVRLLEAFPGLSMKDVYFCCLVKINVSIKDLSDIYCISRTSISRKKQRMRRDKLGLTENNETLDDFCAVSELLSILILSVKDLFLLKSMLYLFSNLSVLSIR